MTRPTLRTLALSLISICCMSLAHAAGPAPDDSDLPETLRRGYVAPIDGPADDNAYARGTLGLVRPNFGRASLFVAWRVMHLPTGALAKESHRRLGDWLNGRTLPAPKEDEVVAWLKLRGSVLPQAPAVAPDYFRHSTLKVSGFPDMETLSGQCGPDAYAFATRTLRELMADTVLQDADRKLWVAGQDAVFAHCSWAPGKTAAPPLPAAVPAQAPAKIKALNAYQHAAALFYGDEFAAARQEFDAIAATPDHPMRAWAVLAALRSVLREAVHDADWDAAVDEAWSKRQLRGAAFNAAVSEAAARHNARTDSLLKDYEARAKAARADATLNPVRPQLDYTTRRMLYQLMPAYPLGLAMTVLDKPEYNPYTGSALDLFQELYPRVSPDRPVGNVATTLRQHAWFDFVATVQACPDAPKPMDTATCDAEHAHALARWQETKENAWLLASLMTARMPAATDVPAADAARSVTADKPEWASLQFYAARVLKAQGRGADARAAMDAVAASAVVHKRDKGWVEAQRAAM